ncbi:hypothetical protein ACWEQ4_00980 [Rhodococcus sp. NPDC003994]
MTRLRNTVRRLLGALRRRYARTRYPDGSTVPGRMFGSPAGTAVYDSSTDSPYIPRNMPVPRPYETWDQFVHRVESTTH